MEGEDCFYVLDNLPVVGLDFHTVPDSVAPHSHRHPHRVPHPSRWNIELLLLARSFPPALECLSLSSHWQAALQPAVVEVNCVNIYIPLLFPLSSETCTLVSKRIHPCWLSLGFQDFSWLGGVSQPWADPRLLFCECFSLVVCFTWSASVMWKLPVSWVGIGNTWRLD